ncbi:MULTISPECIES: MoaD/ThiS family protein [Commensalibacter]|uniref:Molybdopterin synthase sulfur carrier subunit n=2 Tax=Commensalibacter TaxID=1079922 RepID=W7E431_9PROT|nr:MULTISPECIES: MoaD/ThiS family protein [Commensalibacter]EUK17801.1 molybdopterin converting factor subunit 1 [Commensalibacter papalotli (ex Servin-Garciduenas et al. 2014)]CAI3943856.1 Molybdopterin synthase sulfur carrier subunit MoaD (MoaD) (PDB:1FM0) (PUBMED:32239579) [Commensalibacter papalotli (ex Botero et al. 2024)]CAI3947038.1 Molybdopterin synthase sulfur carrier subunit MoaD (MoaD) (PDB:1FM0) (PUBMED:32239579) [Commensalibacter papalotli (ex Botero et al. 2024)]
MIKIRYFGFLKEILNLEEEQIEWPQGDSQALLTYLRSRSDFWAESLSEQNIFRLAINQKIIYQTSPISSGDEVAILPPVTGG